MADIKCNSAKISVVIPCYNEEACIPLFLERMYAVAAQMPQVVFELIFIDDGSRDGTLQILRRVSAEDPQIRYLSFSRNFGKEAAMLAGLQSATGDYIAVMDADLQHPPELLPEMYAAITEDGFDCATTRRVSRKGDPQVRTFFARMFYRVINKISDTPMVDGAGDFRMMTRQMTDAVLSLTEYNRFSKGLFNWVGFSTKWIEFENVSRAAGETKWSVWKLFSYSLDGIIAFSVKPLAISSLFGVLFCFFAILGAAFVVIRWLLFGDPVAGWASTVCIVLFASGIQLFSVGILGQYLAKTYLEVKGRPVYVVKERNEAAQTLPKEGNNDDFSGKD